jgi:hypothetical protein
MVGFLIIIRKYTLNMHTLVCVLHAIVCVAIRPLLYIIITLLLYSHANVFK